MDGEGNSAGTYLYGSPLHVTKIWKIQNLCKKILKCKNSHFHLSSSSTKTIKYSKWCVNNIAICRIPMEREDEYEVSEEHRTTIESHRGSLLSCHWQAWPGSLWEEPEADHPIWIFFAILFYLVFHKLDFYYMSRTSYQLSADPLPTAVSLTCGIQAFSGVMPSIFQVLV